MGRTAESREAGVWLRQTLWQPLEERLGSAQVVLISPDGALGRLPLAALPGKEAGSYLVEEERLIAVIPSAAALPAWMAEEEAKKELKNMFVVGGVDFDGAVGGGATAKSARPPKAFGRSGEVGGEMQFEFLPATEGELAGIERKYRQNFGPDGITTLEKGAASESAVRQAAQSHKYLHLATHGFFAAPQFKSALSRSALDAARFGQEKLLSEQSIAGFHPNLLSGVVLAGANRPVEQGDDGILTAEEVQTLDLRGAQLVVLSACETGLGQTAGGEGLLGLQRAFQVAGARTVIASLWKVDDVATRDLMDRFYDNLWNGNMGKLQALTEAQRWMLKERGARGLKEAGAGSGDPRTTAAGDRGQGTGNRLAPYFWAAFVLSGDWR
jgi:CHAT domain-containing protein